MTIFDVRFRFLEENSHVSAAVEAIHLLPESTGGFQELGAFHEVVTPVACLKH